IEAARAGEHGRGFAVVAEEVRKLAEESAAAAKDIEELVREIQSGIAATVDAMGAGAQQAETALRDVQRSSEILTGILAAVGQIQRQAEDFSAGLQEISGGGHDIASAAEEQAASMQEVANAAQDLMEMAARLNGLMGQFQLGGWGGLTTPSPLGYIWIGRRGCGSALQGGNSHFSRLFSR